MPKYRFASGVVIDISEDKAARIGGLTPVEEPAKKAPAKKAAPAKKTE